MRREAARCNEASVARCGEARRTASFWGFFIYLPDLQFGGSRGLRGGFLVDSGGGLIHSGLGSVARLFAVGLWGGLPR
uniref:Uncharacterized protein n=1 Tax=Fagus sylvatica TaxID=28930 RepID=A0A2N9I7Q7_FAGSY